LGDLGLAPDEIREPFSQLFCQGMILLEGKAMSKSRGNVVSPDNYFSTVGADALRLYHLFVGPPVEDTEWGAQTDLLIEGCGRYLRRVWRLATGLEETPRHESDASAATGTLVRLRHRTVRDVGRHLDAYAFNTAVSSLMELTNGIMAARRSGGDPAVIDEAIDTLLCLLSPLAPHIAAESWEQRNGGHVHEQPWPTFDDVAIVEATVEMVVQIDGKVRDKFEVDANISEEDATSFALASSKIAELLDGASPVRVIARPPRLVNIVTRR
jgi:leucyl-tRNA synthetase